VPPPPRVKHPRDVANEPRSAQRERERLWEGGRRSRSSGPPKTIWVSAVLTDGTPPKRGGPVIHAYNNNALCRAHQTPGISGRRLHRIPADPDLSVLFPFMAPRPVEPLRPTDKKHQSKQKKKKKTKNDERKVKEKKRRKHRQANTRTRGEPATGPCSIDLPVPIDDSWHFSGRRLRRFRCKRRALETVNEADPRIRRRRFSRRALTKVKAARNAVIFGRNLYVARLRLAHSTN
jgi:hypothetical protein